MVAHNWHNWVGKINGGQNIGADTGVQLHTFEFCRSKLAWLIQNVLGNRELSALSISVNTTEGIVTLSGTVSSAEDISKAMLLAMETDGVREVISTLQVKQTQAKK